jgi:hypothetical protein
MAANSYGTQTDEAYRWHQAQYPASLQYSQIPNAEGRVYTASDVINILKSDFGYELHEDLQ